MVVKYPYDKRRVTNRTMCRMAKSAPHKEWEARVWLDIDLWEWPWPSLEESCCWWLLHLWTVGILPGTLSEGATLVTVATVPEFASFSPFAFRAPFVVAANGKGCISHDYVKVKDIYGRFQHTDQWMGERVKLKGRVAICQLLSFRFYFEHSKGSGGNLPLSPTLLPIYTWCSHSTPCRIPLRKCDFPRTSLPNLTLKAMQW